MSGASQSFTLFLGAVVIVTSVLRYNDTTYDARLQYLVRAFEVSLVGLLIAYTLICAGNTGRDAEMHKYFIVLLCLGFWGLAIFKDDLNAGWLRVNDNVGPGIIQASMFALPMVVYAFKA